MPRTCTICTHAERRAIDAALAKESDSFRNIAKRYGVSITALSRHKSDHLPARLVKAQEATDIRAALDVVAQLRVINGAALSVLKDARDAGDGELMLKAIDRVYRQIELQARLIGELDAGGTVNVFVSPQWVEVRTALVAALSPYPDARQAVALALAALEAA